MSNKYSITLFDFWDNWVTMEKSSRGWCFTWNNYVPLDIEVLKNYKFDYLVFGFEVAPETGTKHLQGYMYIHNKVRFSTLKKLFPLVHLEVAKGSPKQNRDYCTKSGTYEEYGEMPAQGSRNDIRRAIDEVKHGANMRKITSEYNYTAIRTVEKYLAYNEAERHFKPFVIYLYGESGTGKSRICEYITDYLGDTYYCKKDLKWFDKYDAHENIVVEEFRPEDCSCKEFLRLLDRVPYSVAIKGGHREMLAHNIFINTSINPSFIYCNESTKQILRRLDIIIYFGVDVYEIRKIFD